MSGSAVASGWETLLVAGGSMLGASAIDWFVLAGATAPGTPTSPKMAMVESPLDRGAAVGFAGRF